MRLLSRISIACGMTGALIAAALGSAAADPPAGVTPAHTDIVGVGSDTTQVLLDNLSVDYNATSPARKLYSFDAVGSSPIIPKTGCSAISRPDGANAGIAALATNTRPSGDTADYCIDFAGSARNPLGASMAFVAFAQDAVTWSATSTAAKPTHAPSGLSIVQLRAIYHCDASILGTGHTGPVTWNEVGGTGTNAVVPVLPQPNSDTRTFFLNALGVAGGGCVSSATVEANEGTDPVFSGTNSQDLVFPYSVGVYLAQSQDGFSPGTQGNQTLQSVLRPGSPPVAVVPTAGTAPHKVINPVLATVGLLRTLYNVVRNTGTSTHVPSYLQPLLGTASDTGYLCTNPTAQADITNYGFRTLGAACGTTTIG